MPAPVLTERLSAAGAALGEYCGATAANSFGDPSSEYATLRSGCGVYQASWRALFAISGKDRTRWLNGMVSNNIRDLQPGRGVYAFVLNPQGHILGDLYAWNMGEHLIAEIESFQAEQLVATLKRYIIMDKVEFTDEQARRNVLALAGPGCEAVLRGVAIDSPALAPLECADIVWQGHAMTLARLDHPLVPHYELWAAPALIADLWLAATSAGAQPVGTRALELLRIVAGVPRYGQDIRARDLPQETGQERALNYNKGCYIGQEIVERIRARGRVHRTWTGFRVEGDPPGPGKIMADGKDAGEITSAAKLPAGTENIALALGYVRRELAGVPLASDGRRVVPQPLPFNL